MKDVSCPSVNDEVGAPEPANLRNITTFIIKALFSGKLSIEAALKLFYRLDILKRQQEH